jgi:predicted aminopeptidase
VLGVALASPGCYYGHLASGQLRLLFSRSSTEGVRADPETPERVRAQLDLVDATLAFAETLGLEVGGRYTSYVEWPGDRVVTTVVATRPGEIEPADFDFPIIGRAPYKGFFDAARAEALADELRSEGLDVCVSPVSAYSTLGWFDDPITTPMLKRDDAALVETILHELVHATVFVESEPEFNESAARFVGQEGSVQFFSSTLARGDTGPGDTREPGAAARARVDENRRVDAALLAFRKRVGDLYAREHDATTRATERAALEAAARDELARLPLEERDPATLAARARLSDACLALRGTYTEDMQRLADVLAALDGDLASFVERLREAAGADDPRDTFVDAGARKH